MITHSNIRQHHLYALIRKGIVSYGGNAKLKIFGRLDCTSGKRLKKSNRIFFSSLQEAVVHGFRPCGNCMRNEFKKWKMTNLLPYDGKVLYFGKVLALADEVIYFDQLFKTIEWKNDEAVIFGKHFITKRKAAWYGDLDFSYTYSNTTKQALPWTKALLDLKKLVEGLTGTSFNSCLLNLYHNGDEGMAWHSDDEKSLGKDSSIASLSLGAERKFLFRHKKTRETIPLALDSGSLLVMKEATQSNWQHSLPKTKKVTQPRINLTFRTMVHSNMKG